MTTRQQRRLQLAEQVCRLVIRHHSCGLEPKEGYRPDVVAALHMMQSFAEKDGNLKPGALHWLGEAAVAIENAVYAWMNAVGLDPKTFEKQEAQAMAMDIAKDALGPEYEAEYEQTDEVSPGLRFYSGKTADERAFSLVQDFSSGQIKTPDELRIAIAAEILESEYGARRPFLDYSEVIFRNCDSHRTGTLTEAEERAFHDAVSKATCDLLCESSRWMDLRPAKPVGDPK